MPWSTRKFVSGRFLWAAMRLELPYLLVLQVLVVPLRLTLINRHPFEEHVLWLSEATLVLPYLDVLVDLMFIGDAVFRAIREVSPGLGVTSNAPFTCTAAFIHAELPR